MYRRWLLIAALVCGSGASPTIAGMPAALPISPSAFGKPVQVASLTEWAVQRLDAISFFLLVLFLSAGATQFVWNLLQRDFPQWPRLNYGRALCLVLIWGCLFVVVLTMISGARELMTPGAWERQGATYRVKSAAPTDVNAIADAERRQRLIELRTELWRYAAVHQGQFPKFDPAQSTVPAYMWQLPDLPNQRFHYVAGQSASEQPDLLAYEPELGLPTRLVLRTDGSIVRLKSWEISRLIQKAGK